MSALKPPPPPVPGNYGRLPDHEQVAPTTAAGTPYMSGVAALGVSVLQQPSADDNICVECHVNRAQRPRVVCLPCVDEARRRSAMLLTNAEIDAAVEQSAAASAVPASITVYRPGRADPTVLHLGEPPPPPPSDMSDPLPVARRPAFLAPRVPVGIPLAGASSLQVRSPPPPIASSSSSTASTTASSSSASAVASTLFVGDAPNIPSFSGAPHPPALAAVSFSPPVPRAARNRAPPPEIKRRAAEPLDAASARARGTTNFGVLLDDSAAASRANAASLIADDSDREDNAPPLGDDNAADNMSADGAAGDDSDDELDPPPPPPAADSDNGSNQYVSTSMLLNAAAAAAASRPMYAEFKPLMHPQPEYLALTPAEELTAPTPIARLTNTRSAPGIARVAFAAPPSPVLSPTPPSSAAPNRPAPPRRTASRAPPVQQPPAQPPAAVPHQRPGANAPEAPRRARTLVRDAAPGVAPVRKKQSFILGARTNAAVAVSDMPPPPPPILARKAASDVGEHTSDADADPPPPPPPPDSPTIGAPPVRRRSQVTYENLPVSQRNQTYVQLGPEGIQPLPPTTTTTTHAAVASLPVAQRKPAAAAAGASQYGSVTALAPPSLTYVALSASEQIGRK